MAKRELPKYVRVDKKTKRNYCLWHTEAPGQYFFLPKLRNNFSHLIRLNKSVANDHKHKKDLARLVALRKIIKNNKWENKSITNKIEEYRGIYSKLSLSNVSNLTGKEKTWLRALMSDKENWRKVFRLFVTVEPEKPDDIFTTVRETPRLPSLLWVDYVEDHLMYIVLEDSLIDRGLRGLAKALIRSVEPEKCLRPYYKKIANGNGVFVQACKTLFKNLQNDETIAERAIHGDFISFSGLEKAKDSRSLLVGQKVLINLKVDIKYFQVASLMTAILMGKCKVIDNNGRRKWSGAISQKIWDCPKKELQEIYDAFLLAMSLPHEDIMNNLQLTSEQFFSDSPLVTMEGLGTPQKCELVTLQLYQGAEEGQGKQLQGLNYIVETIRRFTTRSDFDLALPNTGLECRKLLEECQPLLETYENAGKTHHFDKPGVSSAARTALKAIVKALVREESSIAAASSDSKTDNKQGPDSSPEDGSNDKEDESDDEEDDFDDESMSKLEASRDPDAGDGSPGDGSPGDDSSGHDGSTKERKKPKDCGSSEEEGEDTASNAEITIHYAQGSVNEKDSKAKSHYEMASNLQQLGAPKKYIQEELLHAMKDDAGHVDAVIMFAEHADCEKDYKFALDSFLAWLQIAAMGSVDGRPGKLSDYNDMPKLNVAMKWMSTMSDKLVGEKDTN